MLMAYVLRIYHLVRCSVVVPLCLQRLALVRSKATTQ